VRRGKYCVDQGSGSAGMANPPVFASVRGSWEGEHGQAQTSLLVGNGDELLRPRQRCFVWPGVATRLSPRQTPERCRGIMRITGCAPERARENSRTALAPTPGRRAFFPGDPRQPGCRGLSLVTLRATAEAENESRAPLQPTTLAGPLTFLCHQFSSRRGQDL